MASFDSYGEARNFAVCRHVATGEPQAVIVGDSGFHVRNLSWCQVSDKLMEHVSEVVGA